MESGRSLGSLPSASGPLLSLAKPKLYWPLPGLVGPWLPVPEDGPPRTPEASAAPSHSPEKHNIPGLGLGLGSQLLSQPPGPMSHRGWHLPHRGWHLLPLGSVHHVTSILVTPPSPLPRPPGPGGAWPLRHRLSDPGLRSDRLGHNDGLVSGNSAWPSSRLGVTRNLGAGFGSVNHEARSKQFHLQGGQGWLGSSILGQLCSPEDIPGGHNQGPATGLMEMGAGDAAEWPAVHRTPDIRNCLEQMSTVLRWGDQSLADWSHPSWWGLGEPHLATPSLGHHLAAPPTSSTSLLLPPSWDTRRPAIVTDTAVRPGSRLPSLSPDIP